jgi:hypothetical protein
MRAVEAILMNLACPSEKRAKTIKNNRRRPSREDLPKQEGEIDDLN